MRIMLSGLSLLFVVSVHAAGTIVVNVPATQSQFQVTLPANRTTGYQWTVTHYDKSILQFVASHYIAPQSKLIGAGGKMQFTFSLVAGKTYPASTDIHFKYAQPWEPKSRSLQTVTVNFYHTRIKK